MFIHLITCIFCQAPQIPRFDRTEHRSSSPEIHGIMKETEIRQVKIYKMTNNEDHYEGKNKTSVN